MRYSRTFEILKIVVGIILMVVAVGIALMGFIAEVYIPLTR